MTTPHADPPAAALPTGIALALPPALATLAALFGAPLDRGDVAALARPVDRGPLAPLAGIPALRPGAEAAVALVAGLGDTDAAVSSLNRSYCDLFLGAGGRLTAAPYESAHRGSGRLFQEPAAEMAALLNRQGRAIAAGFGEPPDHLAIELALLEDALLRADAGTPGEAAVASALLARLRGWAPAFAAACRAHDPVGFYAEAAGLLIRLLDWAAVPSSDQS